MAEIVTTQVKPDTQSYLSCDTTGNCCDLETNICQNINYDGSPATNPAGFDINLFTKKISDWVQKNPLMAIGGVLGLVFITGGGGRRGRY